MTDRKAIDFAKSGEAAKINYSIPMPGAHTGRRVMEIDLDFTDPPQDTFEPDAIAFGTSPSDMMSARFGETIDVDEHDAKRFFLKDLASVGVAASSEPPSGGPVPPAASDSGMRLDLDLDGGFLPLDADMVAADTQFATPADIALDVGATATIVETPRLVSPQTMESAFSAYLSDLKHGEVSVPMRDWAGELVMVTRPLFAQSDPKFFIVEYYGVSSFLGDYGMGRTVKTFTLLPGESTTISLKTWNSTKESQKEASSIIDSHQQSARKRFADKVQKETTDKATKKKTEKWHVEAEVGFSWGFGSAKGSGGGGGEYHSGREQFSKRVGSSVSEHAAEASAKRELSVNSSSERTNESGEEAVIEREIGNVNKRRVLNFVFRELNQTYNTKLHLKDIRIGFTNGKVDTWREVSISQLRPLLQETLRPQIVDKVARQILRATGRVFDHSDLAVSVLEQVALRNDGGGAEITPAATDSNGDYTAPTDNLYYRIRQGPLEQDGHSNPVDGVLLNTQQITMRTDSVVVEALLGQADALDNYAMQIQEAAATKESLTNKRDELILQTLSQISDPVERAKLAVRLLGACCKDDKSEE